MITSTSGLIALLDDPSNEIRVHAVRVLNDIVSWGWPEISDAITKIEQLANDASFGQHHLAALLVSKLHFNLGQYEQSIDYALLAGPAFDVHESGSEYVECILTKTIDRYIQCCKSNTPIDDVLKSLVERIISRCLNAGQVKQVIGIAIEARRTDIIHEVLNQHPLACYSVADMIKSVTDAGLAQTAIWAIIEVCLDNYYKKQGKSNVDCVFLADCLAAFGSWEKFHSFAEHLKQNNHPMYPQIAYNHGLDVSPLPSLQKLHLHFLSSCNASDMLILEQTRASISPTASMHHSALSASNSIMHAGTTCDMFLRKNMDWLSHANNWSKFTAVSGMGLIHRGRIGDGEKILEAYLPNEDSFYDSTAPYSEAGALFALGLIGDRQSAQYLINVLEKTEDEVLIHGAMYGIAALVLSGVNDLATKDLFDQLRTIYYRDETIGGEASALLTGILRKGTNSIELENMLIFADETQHEKVSRSFVIGVAITLAGTEEDALSTALKMLDETDAVVRYGGAWALALAYAATSSNVAIKYLLHVAVSDANDDVRRAAVTGLGFVMLRTPLELLSLLELSIESFNPHVRYGSAMALGIAFAGTANSKCVEMLHPLIKDPIDMVRQGALISLALVFCNNHDNNSNENTFNSTSFRAHLANIISTRYEAPLTKFGAILSQGIIDCGGRNARPLFLNPTLIQSPNFNAIISMVLFCQYWYWYPMMHFFGLTLNPCALMVVDTEGRVPQGNVLGLTLNGELKEKFAYPPPVKTNVTETPQMVATAVLSVTAKAEARAAKKTGTTPLSPTAMQVDEQPAKVEEKQSVEVQKQSKPENKEPMPIQNFTRVLPEELALLKTNKNINGASIHEPIYKDNGMRKALGVIVVHKNNDCGSFIQLLDGNVEGDSKGKDNEIAASASIETSKDDMNMVD